MAEAAQTETWCEAVVRVLKDNEIRLVCYVPDNILAQLIRLIEGDPYFVTVCPAREEEAVGIVCGAYMAGLRGIVLMQTSGFATLPNVLASLASVYQIPLLMMISERGVLGEFQVGQTAVCRTMRPVLDALAIDHFTLKECHDVDFVVGAIIKQAYATHVPGAVILSPMLTRRPVRPS